MLRNFSRAAPKELFSGLFLFEAHLRDFFVGFGFTFLVYTDFHETEVGFDGFARAFGIAFDDLVVDEAVLIEQGFAGGAHFEHDLAVIEHARAQHFEHGAHHVQHKDVVGCFDDGHVEFGVKGGLFGGALRCGGSALLYRDACGS